MSYADKGHNGLQHTPITSPPFVPKPVFKIEIDPYPTTMQVDRSAFKLVVQLLTGSSETSKQVSDSILPSLPAPSSKAGVHPRRQGGSNLYERRNNNLKNCLMLNTVVRRVAYSNNSGRFSPTMPEALSSSMLDFSQLALSPVTPLTEDLFNKPSPCMEYEKATIAKKRFFLHSSPRTLPRNAEPKLLQLFPSPRD